MIDMILYEYSIIRYVPDIDRGECINVGLIMMCKKQKWIRTYINADTNRVKSFANTQDISFLKHQLSMFIGCDVPKADLPVEEKYRWMVAAKSAIIQCSPSHPGIILYNERDNNANNSSDIALSLLSDTFDRLCEELVN